MANSKMKSVHAPKLLVIGRSGCGKDTMRKELERMGLSFVKSYTTRPKRSPDEDTHVFVTEDEALSLLDSEGVIAQTEIDGQRYFATETQLKDADGYIIDPEGADELCGKCPDVPFIVCYIKADDAIRKMGAVSRASDPVIASDAFDSRHIAEDPRFKKFENNWLEEAGPHEHPDNIVAFELYENDFTPQGMALAAARIAGLVCMYSNLAKMVDEAVECGLLNLVETNLPRYLVPFALEADDARLAEFMRNVLSVTDVDITATVG